MNETLFRIHLVAKGLKISDIERDLDIPRASINKWLKNETGIQLNKAVQIANYTGYGHGTVQRYFLRPKVDRWKLCWRFFPLRTYFTEKWG